MSSDDQEAQVRHQLLTHVGPSILEADLIHVSESQSSFSIRAELRKRGLSSPDKELLSRTPMERRLVFQLPGHAGPTTHISRYRKIIVYVDAKGQVLDALESR